MDVLDSGIAVAAFDDAILGEAHVGENLVERHPVDDASLAEPMAVNGLAVAVAPHFCSEVMDLGIAAREILEAGGGNRLSADDGSAGLHQRRDLAQNPGRHLR